MEEKQYGEESSSYHCRRQWHGCRDSVVMTTMQAHMVDGRFDSGQAPTPAAERPASGSGGESRRVFPSSKARP